MWKLKKVVSNRGVALTFIVLLILILDQFIKNYAQSNIEIVCNKGIAFGFGSNATVLTLIVCSLVFWILTKEKRFLPIAGLTLIFAGGISNILDRINFGCVRDFITIFNLPVFNLADVMIFTGASMVLVDLFKNKR